jgi:hypothetical protein
LDPTEVYLLDELIKPKPGKSHRNATMTDYIIKIARLGGYLNRASDPPPGISLLCGEACRNSMTRTWVSLWRQNLWAIESFA